MAEVNPELWEEVTTAVQLTEFARAAVDEYDLGDTLGGDFPVRTTPDIEYEIKDTSIERRPVAQYRTYGAASPISSGEYSATTTSGRVTLG